MFQEVAQFFKDTYLTVIAMGIFITVFTLVTIYVMRKSRADFYNRLAQMPLAKESNNE